MNRSFRLAALAAALGGVCALASAAQSLPFNVYTDANAPDNHYVPSGWMGDFGDVEFKSDWNEGCHSGQTCIKITYTAARSQGADWAGIYWQDPANNWGDRPGGYDLSGAKKVTFWARGEKGGEKLDEFRAGGIPGENFDSDVAYMGPVALTAEWKQYEVDLNGKDLSSIKGGFMWSARAGDNKAGLTFYLDDIRYE